MGYALGRAFASFWRFRTVPFAERLFRDVEAPCVLTRGLFGYDFSVDVSRSITHRLLYLDGERMIDERRLVMGLVEPGMRIVDVGANIGYYLLMFERALKGDGEIVGFEPERDNRAELRRNIERNGFRNVTVHDAALGESNGTAGLCAGINSRVTPAGGDYAVPLRSLDAMLDGPVDLIKIDVDGYEAHVLRGARDLLARERPRVFLEYHPHHVPKFGYSFDEVYGILRACYDDITFYEAPLDRGPLAKIGRRYFGAGLVRHIKDGERLIEETRSGVRQRTYWMVCR